MQNSASNAVGNLLLHLCGNIRQWIISGLGGKPDVRKRDEEFAERGRVSRRMLIATLKQTAEEARHTLDSMSPATLDQEFAIQGYRVFGRSAVSIVYEHFACHAGQIIYVAKLKRGKDLGFTHLQPEPKHAKTEARSPSRSSWQALRDVNWPSRPAHPRRSKPVYETSAYDSSLRRAHLQAVSARITEPASAQILIRWRIMCVCQKNEQKRIKPSDKPIYSTRSRPTVHHRIRGKNNARTSTKPLCGSSKRLL